MLHKSLKKSSSGCSIQLPPTESLCANIFQKYRRPWHVHLGIGAQPEQKLFDHPRHSTFFVDPLDIQTIRKTRRGFTS